MSQSFLKIIKYMLGNYRNIFRKPNDRNLSEKAFDAKIWHYFKSKKELARYYLFNSLEHNFYISKNY